MPLFTFRNMKISGVSVAIPDICLDNNQDIIAYHSIVEQTASDLGYIAADDLLKKTGINSDEIGVLIFCTCTPDYPIPSTAFVLHNRLNLNQDCIVYDVNAAQAGFIYGLQIACSILLSINKKYALLISADTMSKLNSSEIPYSDAGSAFLIEKNNTGSVFTTQCFASGDDFKKEIFPTGAYRHQHIDKKLKNEKSRIFSDSQFNNTFFYNEIKKTIQSWIHDNSLDDYDYFAVRETNDDFMDLLSGELQIPLHKRISSFSDYKDTGISSIPLTIIHNKENFDNQELRFLTISYGAGLSWGFAHFTVSKECMFSIIKSNDFYSDGNVELV